ncbi:unnamed protein product [Enterobius vermicularis]|uniref:Secreted protein n=1 Tax=Enterobius vermicularis TaxID=51028 RepID=A0A0N4V7L7_ENTVE|nr:unnamed protein product [Enterobius vermicularis]
MIYYVALIVATTQRPTFAEQVVLDETRFSNPSSFDYSFYDDDDNVADSNDIYDELVPYLPGFNVHKNGVDIGYTRVPIVTRKAALWSTQTTRPSNSGTYRGWHTTPIPRYGTPANHPIYELNTIE